MAVLRRGAPEIINTGRGSQFTSPTFTAYVDCFEQTRFSLDGKGRAIDNIFIERFWRNIKYEKIYPQPSEDGHGLYGKIKWYMNFYNTERGTSLWIIKGLKRCFARPLRFSFLPKWAERKI